MNHPLSLGSGLTACSAIASFKLIIRNTPYFAKFHRLEKGGFFIRPPDKNTPNRKLPSSLTHSETIPTQRTNFRFSHG